MAVVELETKKRDLLIRLESVEKIELLINTLTYKIYEMQHDYRSEKEKLQREHDAILTRTDLTESEKALLLEDLGKKIQELEVNHQQIVVSLEAQRKVS